MSNGNFNSPEDFLKHLQVYLKNEPPIQGEGHEEFTRINLEQLKKLEKLKKYTPEQLREGKLIIDNLLKMVQESLSKEELKRVNECIAFGKVQNTFCNALCIKSRDNKYAILIYEGLMMLIHKHSKLVLAALHPEKVLSCSRGEPSELKSEDYRDFAQELIENYKTLGTAMGAMIKFDLDFTGTHSFNLILQELFVICHELGHFFNGDLENDKNYYRISQLDWDIFNNNQDHLMEFKADLTGFSIFEKAVLSQYPDLPRKYLVLILSQLFDLLALINEKPSESHPAPIDRILNIIEYNFGKKDAELYLETYNNKDKLGEFFDL